MPSVVNDKRNKWPLCEGREVRELESGHNHTTNNLI